ncbi:luciferase-like protein [Mycobacterium gallinarum]|uniref:Luciferase-like protein n=1 Tax=Mycobacterium gallinarum TaxID=39689 RepID=A0A9W4B3Q9_9MYCO|nr:LLM class flavin-dependent oxidoreductase [Mycobacterium gallinarum]BBY90410.1 luciferase-like protein [Mycobacterium gallinarum]
MRTVGSGLFLPPFEALADPVTVARLSAEAEEAGWTGVFVWDHLRWCEPISAIADPWITLAAMATATSRIRIGPMVTPLARRRPAKVAKETATLDVLSGGRLTFGVGLGSDAYGVEYTKTGEEVDDRKRAAMLDESLEVVTRAWTGEEVVHRGEHYTVDGVRFLPRPVQQPRIPIWVAGLIGNKRPRRRAARFDGYFPVFLETADQAAEAVADINALGPKDDFDFVVPLSPGTDPAPYIAAGATWWMVEFPWASTTVDLVRGVIREGPLK